MSSFLLNCPIKCQFSPLFIIHLFDYDYYYLLFIIMHSIIINLRICSRRYDDYESFLLAFKLKTSITTTNTIQILGNGFLQYRQNITSF